MYQRCFFIFWAIYLAAGESTSLQLVQILFRHGDRTPDYTFPTDPHRYYWKEGVETLTKLGELQQFQLGRFLRKRYRDFLPSQYHFNHTVVRSTDDDRAILSAQSQLLGLFEAPVDTGVSKDRFPLPQLVPIHTVPKPQDQVLKATSPCPAYERLWLEIQKSELWKNLVQEYRPLFEDLQRWTGLKKVGLVQSYKIADPLFAWIAHNLSLPSWATPEVIEKMHTIQNLMHSLGYHSRAMQRLRGGPLVGVMTENMLEKINGNDLHRRRLMYSYSAHDSTVAAVLMYLGVYNKILPPYCACLIVELHETIAEDDVTSTEVVRSVRLFHKNDSRHQPWNLTIPGCEFDCPLEKFIELTKGNLPENIAKECFETKDNAENFRWPIMVDQNPYSSIITSLSTVVVTLIILVMYRRFKESSTSFK